MAEERNLIAFSGALKTRIQGIATAGAIAALATFGGANHAEAASVDATEIYTTVIQDDGSGVLATSTGVTLSGVDIAFPDFIDGEALTFDELNLDFLGFGGGVVLNEHFTQGDDGVSSVGFASPGSGLSDTLGITYDVDDDNTYSIDYLSFAYTGDEGQFSDMIDADNPLDLSSIDLTRASSVNVMFTDASFLIFDGTGTVTTTGFTSPATTPVPVPPALPLLAAGIGALALSRREHG